MIARGYGYEAVLEFPAGAEHIANQTKKQGWYERLMLEDIVKRVEPGVALDIGAYCGTHTVWFSLVCGLEVVAFEPAPVPFAALTENVARNGVAGQVRLLNLAAGAETGKGRVVEHNGKNTGMNTVEADAAGEVEVVTIDSLNLEDVSLIKIDVEGAEIGVLQGALATIERNKPLIYVEAPDTVDQVRALLAPLGYEQFGQFNATPTFGFQAKRGSLDPA